MDSFWGSSRTRALLLIMLLAEAAVTLHAQRPTGAIRLEVKDPSGSAMEASGRLHSFESGSDRSFKTNAQGVSTFQNLPYGRYRLEISKAGFATESELVEVETAAPIVRTIKLALAPQASEIDVVAATPLPGTDLAIDDIPKPVQTATAHDIEQSGALDLSDLLN